MRDALRAVFEALFKVLFTYDCRGEEQLPVSGPAVIAANHPSFLDPLLLSLQVRRPIRFMAWERLFRLPGLGFLIRLFGAFPVDLRRGRGGVAYEAAKRLVLAGELVGIFPEGQRSTSGWLEPELRAGAARLALETGAPLFPVTIAGAHRAWPRARLVPHPARIRVRYHAPIDPGPYRALPAEEGLAALLAELRQRVERSLRPAVKADLRFNLVYARPAPWPRAHEWLAALVPAALVGYGSGRWAAAWPSAAYLAYLVLDRVWIRQGRLVKWLRNASPLLFLLVFGGRVMQALALVPPPAGAALAAITLGALYPYIYDRGRSGLAFVRGLVLTLGCALVASLDNPLPAGYHVSLPLFAAAFAWERRGVFWRYAVLALLGYAWAAAYLLGGGLGLLGYALAGLLGWLLTRLLPDRLGLRTSGALDGAGLRP
jgi:1-acyl-sn-glycerol-3-phosphate acyltransferase